MWPFNKKPNDKYFDASKWTPPSNDDPNYVSPELAAEYEALVKSLAEAKEKDLAEFKTPKNKYRIVKVEKGTAEKYGIERTMHYDEGSRYPNYRESSYYIEPVIEGFYVQTWRINQYNYEVCGLPLSNSGYNRIKNKYNIMHNAILQPAKYPPRTIITWTNIGGANPHKTLKTAESWLKAWTNDPDISDYDEKGNRLNV